MLSARVRALGGGSRRPTTTVSDLEPAGQAGLRDSEAPGDLRDRLIALPGNGDHVGPELLQERLGHAIQKTVRRTFTAVIAPAPVLDLPARG